MKGVFYCELYEGTRRRSLSLRTSDPAIAAERYGPGMRELRRRLRAEHEAAKGEQARPSWTAQQAIEAKALFEQAHADPTSDWVPNAQDMAEEITGKRKRSDDTGYHLDKDTDQIAQFIYGIGALPLTWDDLVANAETVRKRKTGKGYTESWHRNIKVTIERLTFKPTEATPVVIRKWMDREEKAGMSSTTMKNRLSALQGLIERGITSGYRPDLAPNPFKMVDFSISKELEERRNYYCPTPEDYRKLFKEVLPQQPEKFAVGIELMAWTGCRVSGVKYLRETTKPGWLEVPDVQGTKGGGSAPVPPELWMRGRELKISTKALNKVLKEVHPEMCNHSLRSGFKMLSRMAGIDSQLGESLLMHKLQGLEATYGGNDFPDEAKERGAEAVWDQLKQVIN